MLGLSFASLHPEKVTSLVLVGCGTYDEASRAEYGRRLGQRLGPEGRTRLEDLEARLARATDPQWRDDLLGQIGELTERASSVDPTASLAGDTHPDAVGHKETWDNVLDLQRRCVEPARFVGVLCPVLMLHGDEDPHPGHAIADSLRPYIPQLAFLGLPRCGHVPWYERHGREPFMRDLRQWIEDVG
jgi:pimeloyl-ACP methyl ester carboxylesterase